MEGHPHSLILPVLAEGATGNLEVRGAEHIGSEVALSRQEQVRRDKVIPVDLYYLRLLVHLETPPQQVEAVLVLQEEMLLTQILQGLVHLIGARVEETEYLLLGYLHHMEPLVQHPVDGSQVEVQEEDILTRPSQILRPEHPAERAVEGLISV